VKYRILVGERLADEIRRVGREQLDAALEGLTSSPDPEGGVHEVRRRLKKVRTLLRLVRGPLGEAYATENKRLRDRGRALADVRDAQVARETFDRVFPEPRSRGIRALRERLAQDQRRAAARGEPLERRLRTVRKQLLADRRRITRWPLRGVRGFDALGAGAARSYRRGRRALKRAEDGGGPEDFHEWRKRVKYHRDQVRLLEDTWRRPLKARRRSLGRLSDLLGEAHDLFMLRQWLARLGEEAELGEEMTRVLADLDRRRRALEGEALPVGRRLFIEKPKHLVRRVRVCWNARESEVARGDETERRRTA
jgi:CHAD domain-containing protein